MSGIMVAGIFGNPFTVTTAAGQAWAGTTGSHAFTPNPATIQGGVGPFTYLWSFLDDGYGFTWSLTNGTTATATFHVSGLTTGDHSSATLFCTVTDTATGLTTESVGVLYTYYDNTTGVIP